MRYNRLRDIGLTEEQIKKNLLFTTDKVGDTMKIAMRPERRQGLVRRGAAGPVGDRARPRGHGADYLYTYLRTFYRDDTRPTGWNNLVFPNVGMPHVLWAAAGHRARAKFETKTDEARRKGHNVSPASSR